MNIVDTSGWIAFLNGDGNADFFAEPIGNIEKLLIPTICMYELFKFIKRKEGESEAIKIAAQLKQGKIIPLTETIALEAASISIEYKLAMADSIIYATARMEGAVVWTQDQDFDGLPGVKFFTT